MRIFLTKVFNASGKLVAVSYPTTKEKTARIMSEELRKRWGMPDYVVNTMIYNEHGDQIGMLSDNAQET